VFFVGKKSKDIIQDHHHHLYQKEISSTNSLTFAFGSHEHCGRVRGLGLGPYPSKVFGSKGHSYSGTFASFSF